MQIANYESPFELCPDLKEEYLEELSKEILHVVELTMLSHNTAYDDNYTVETSIYGRTRQLFLQLGMDASRPWIKVKSKTMDYVASICNIPVRVFKDDPISPRKKKIFFKNDCEQNQLSLLFEEQDSELASQLIWRLFIQAPATFVEEGGELEDLEDDFRIVLVGYNSMSGEIRAMWQSKSTANMIPVAINDELPAAKVVERRAVKPKGVDSDLASGDGK